MLNNTDRLQLRRKRMAQSPALLRGGFRPFFVGAAAWAVISLAVWIMILFDLAHSQLFEDPLAWHRHEMLFGFVGAAIAGFALTAVPNWTGRLPIAGGPLAMLFGIWVAGRLLPFLVSPENLLLLIIEPGFYVLLALLLAREIIKSRNRNFPIVAVIGLFGIADLVDRVAMAGLLEMTKIGWQSGLALVVFLISVIGGRIVPSFTRNWLMAQHAGEPMPTQPDRFDKVVLVFTALALMLWLFWPSSVPTGVGLIATAIAHFVRLVRWQGWRCRTNALLSILHVGYLWLPAGLFLLALAQLTLVSETAAIHALTAGAMATMILAVMSRASLGHTGRELAASKLTTIAFVLINIAAVMRVSAALGIEEQRITLILAAFAWFAAFGLFLLEYIPILFSESNKKGSEERS